MIYLFRIISDEDPEFARHLIAEGSDTFLDFHHALQKDLGYDPAQLASFYITNEMWEKQQEITLIDMMLEQEMATLTMDQVTLDEFITEENQHLIYLFDFFSERAFFIELIERSEKASPRNTPFISQSKGDAPPQLALDLLTDKTDSFPDEDDTNEEPPDLRLDDLDPDMFDSGLPEDF